MPQAWRTEGPDQIDWPTVTYNGKTYMVKNNAASVGGVTIYFWAVGRGRWVKCDTIPAVVRAEFFGE